MDGIAKDVHVLVMVQRYVPDLTRFAAVCEANYHRLGHLERLGPDADSDVFFRLHDGGSHRMFGFTLDISCYSKALGNGYPINAIVGKDEIMKSARKSFMSSTFWTDRIGPVAAIKTLEVMERIKSWEIITRIGNKVRKNWMKNSDAKKRNTKKI